jgi:hypothetical protein
MLIKVLGAGPGELGGCFCADKPYQTIPNRPGMLAGDTGCCLGIGIRTMPASQRWMDGYGANRRGMGISSMARSSPPSPSSPVIGGINVFSAVVYAS